jgi:hypothetical protein
MCERWGGGSQQWAMNVADRWICRLGERSVLVASAGLAIRSKSGAGCERWAGDSEQSAVLVASAGLAIRSKRGAGCERWPGDSEQARCWLRALAWRFGARAVLVASAGLAIRRKRGAGCERWICRLGASAVLVASAGWRFGASAVLVVTGSRWWLAMVRAGNPATTIVSSNQAATMSHLAGRTSSSTRRPRCATWLLASASTVDRVGRGSSRDEVTAARGHGEVAAAWFDVMLGA